MKLLLRAVLASVLLANGLFFIHAIPADAFSENILLYQLQTGGAGTGTASQELILIYNLGEDIEVSDWCVEYSSSSDNPGFSACINPPAQTELWLASGGVVSFATQEFLNANPDFIVDVTMSGGMSASGGHVRLLNSDNQEIDKLGWGTAVNPEGLPATIHPAGMVLSRNLLADNPDNDVNMIDFASVSAASEIVSGLYEVEVEVDFCPNLQGVQSAVPDSYGIDDSGNCQVDVCLNLAGLQASLPEGYFIPEGKVSCEELPLEDRVIFITELLPNPPSYDTDQEFIELYNPNAVSISLKGYRIEVGPSFSKSFILPSITIKSRQYMTFKDTLSNITLPNSSGVQLRLISPAGTVVSSSDFYTNAGDDVSWALVEDQWIFTNQITPNSANKPYIEQANEEIEGSTIVYAPCPAGKYRNPETNRCRNIETAVSALTPCDEDEYRNPETNRCRKLASLASTLIPCPEGQERNPDTNRCRKVAVLASNTDIAAEITDVPVTTTTGKINWIPIGAAVFGTIGYMLYEWRSELSRALVKIK